MANTKIHGHNQIQGLTILDAEIAVGAGILSSKLADGANFLQKNGSVVMIANLDFGTNKAVNLSDPVNPQDAATRSWVLSQVSSLVNSSTTTKVATTANIVLSGAQTIDGIAVAAGDLVLVKNQTTASGNGIYTVSAGAWSRAPSMDTWAEVPGTLVTVQQGTANADTLWLSVADAGGTINSTAINFSQIPGPSDIQAGAGLLRTGQVIDLIAADTSLQVNPDSAQVKLDPARAITVAAGGIGVNIDPATLQIGSNVLAVKANLYIAASNYIVRDTPAGAIDGVNTVFTLTSVPNPANTEQVFLNGILQEPGSGNDYTISGGTITFAVAPPTGSRIKASYLNRTTAPA